jgi:hypothetical protein
VSAFDRKFVQILSSPTTLHDAILTNNYLSAIHISWDWGTIMFCLQDIWWQSVNLLTTARMLTPELGWRASELSRRGDIQIIHMRVWVGKQDYLIFDHNERN